MPQSLDDIVVARDTAIIDLNTAAKYSKVDRESAHSNADSILCAFLIVLGHKDVVDVYDSFSKWYA